MTSVSVNGAMGYISRVCSDESRGNVRKVSSATVRFDTSNNNSTTAAAAAAQEGTYVLVLFVRVRCYCPIYLTSQDDLLKVCIA